jgi:hypothetical protein
MNYETWKASVLGQVIGDGQCVSLVVNNGRSYTAALFPGISWEDIMPPVASAYQLANKSNQYLNWVANDVNDANQLPSQGDIMVFGPTPAAGHTDQFVNPDGHTGVCESANSNGYNLLAQNSPSTGDAANITYFAWDYRPCLGWYTIVVQTAPTPPTPVIPPTPVTPPTPSEPVPPSPSPSPEVPTPPENDNNGTVPVKVIPKPTVVSTPRSETTWDVIIKFFKWLIK